jgi:hypothetical protein
VWSGSQDSDASAGRFLSQEINIGEMVERKAAEEERVPYNFDDVVSREQKKQQGDHQNNTPGLTGSDVKKSVTRRLSEKTDSLNSIVSLFLQKG